MAFVYTIIKEGELYRPVIWTDYEGFPLRLCNHDHRTKREAERCLEEQKPDYLKNKKVEGVLEHG